MSWEERVVSHDTCCFLNGAVYPYDGSVSNAIVLLICGVFVWDVFPLK